MKNILLILVGFVFFATHVKAQYVVIPDDVFRTFLMNKYPSCFDDGTGRLNTSCSAVATEDTLIIANLGIQDLAGIEAFSSLKYLDCSHNIISIDPNNPTFLLPNSILHLNCSYSFQPSGNDPPFTYLPTLPTNLSYLDCSENSTLKNISIPSSVTYLNCSGDGLYTLPQLPKTLTYLDCSTQIDGTLEPQPLVLTSLPTLPDSLKTLICYYNAIAVLPPLPKSLDSLDCHFMYSGNSSDFPNLTPTFACLPVLPSSLTHLSCDVRITCLPNFIPGLFTDTYTNSGSYPNYYIQIDTVILPVCNPTNDVNHCQGFPVISGNVFYDNNSNGIKDANEMYASDISLQLFNTINNKKTFTNSTGNFQISPDSIGNYILALDIPGYYKAIPDSINYNFDTYDTSVSQNIALQPTANVDSFKITLTPLFSTPRPGFDFPYLVTYSNTGTTTLSPTITLNYSNILLDYDSSNNSSVINNGSNLSLAESALQPGQVNSFIAYFTLNTSDAAGEVLFTNASINANATLATDSTNSVIRSSYDPNDKEATPQLTPKEVMEGKSINYLIHFQNTGNATATNIVIADTLNNQLDATSVQMVGSSNPCKVTVTGNVVFFEFLNILLPDSNSNELGSHGFVNFTVNPLSSVSGGFITNAASIYFDYNTPVLTNTTTTLIQDSNTIIPVTLLSFTSLTQPNNNNTLLYWVTSSEINTAFFDVEQSADGISFTSLASITAKGLGGNSYSYNLTQNLPVAYYRLKMIDNNGHYTYSNILVVKNDYNTESVIVLNNPVQNTVSIKTNAASLNNTIARIFNSEGALVKSFVLHKGIQTVDVSSLPSGAYYIQTQLISLKMIITRDSRYL